MPSIRVAIVNDYEVVVAGLAALLSPYSDRIEVLTGPRKLSTVADIVLYDTFAAANAARVNVKELAGDSSAKVVMFGWDTHGDGAGHAYGHGAHGYLSKQMSAAALVTALEAIHADRPVSAVASPSRAVSAADWPGRGFGLSLREAEVIALITQGLMNQEIADTMFLSVNSIKTYIRTAYRKIGATRRAEAVRWGMNNGFHD